MEPRKLAIVVADGLLSWKAKGIYAVLFMLVSARTMDLNRLARLSSSGRATTQAALNELIKYKYIEREIIRKNGRFAQTKYNLL